jgi:hypothetical protein
MKKAYFIFKEIFLFAWAFVTLCYRQPKMWIDVKIYLFFLKIRKKEKEYQYFRKDNPFTRCEFD